MHPCPDCGDDAEMMSKETSCPQCNSTRIRVIPNPSYKKEQPSKFICGVCGDHVEEYTYNKEEDVDECNNCK